jgi:hypothetical protein
MTIKAWSLEKRTIFSAVEPHLEELFVSTSSTLLGKADFIAAKKSLLAPRKSSCQEIRANLIVWRLKSHFATLSNWSSATV